MLAIADCLPPRYAWPGSWVNSGSTFDKALDGDSNTFSNGPAPDGNYVGIDSAAPTSGCGIVAALPNFLKRDSQIVLSLGPRLRQIGLGVDLEGGAVSGNGLVEQLAVVFPAAPRPEFLKRCAQIVLGRGKS